MATKTLVENNKLQKSFLCLELLIGLALAWIGLIASSGQFTRLIPVILLGVPGLIITALSAYALQNKSSHLAKIVIICGTAYLLAVAGVVIWTRIGSNRNNNFYNKLYNQVKNGMTYEQVQKLADGKQSKCSPSPSTDINYPGKECTWIEIYYSNDGVVTGMGRNYVSVTFDTNGFVTGKNKPTL